MVNLPWIEKYRPHNLSDIVAHKDILIAVRNLSNEPDMPHLIFYGPCGTGKTSTILALSRHIYGNKIDFMALELNASDQRGITTIRDVVRDFVSTQVHESSKKFKLVVLDECDALTKEAQAALRRMMEKNTNNARFCLICNHLSRIIPALLSRCSRFRFAPINDHDMRERLYQITSQEKIAIENSGVEAIIKISQGDMRRALNILQTIQLTANTINENVIYDLIGYPRVEDIQEIIFSCLHKSPVQSLERIIKIKMGGGFSLAEILWNVTPFIIRMDLPLLAILDLIENIADLEYRLACGADEKIQIASFIGAFYLARCK
jgi:replication factor C subunit 3/5